MYIQYLCVYTCAFIHTRSCIDREAERLHFTKPKPPRALSSRRRTKPDSSACRKSPAARSAAPERTPPQIAPRARLRQSRPRAASARPRPHVCDGAPLPSGLRDWRTYLGAPTPDAPTRLPDCSAAGAPPAGRAHPALRLRAPRQGGHPTDDDDEAGSTQIAPEQKPPCAKAPKKK